MHNPPRPHVDIYDFEFAEALQAEPAEDTRRRMNIVPFVAGVVLAIAVFALGAGYGVWISQ